MADKIDVKIEKRLNLDENDLIIDRNDCVLITGSNGFIGTRLVKTLLDYGFTNLRCLVRPSSNLTALNEVIKSHRTAKIDVVTGNLLSQEDCEKITDNVLVIYHLAAGRGDKSYPNAYLNSVVTTRNLLEGASRHRCLARFVNVSSFTVYSNSKIRRGGMLDETCAVEADPVSRGEAYCYAKVKQEEIAAEFCARHGIPLVTLRPGVVYGPGKKGLHGRVGIGTFGLFLHLGGSNRIPLTYVDNCADAMALGGIISHVDGQIFNIVDDNLPKSREFLKRYKKNVAQFRSLYVPYRLFYLFSFLWERYSKWSEGQLPPAFNRKSCANYWKGNRYSNEKLKKMLRWRPQVNFEEAANQYFEYQRQVRGKK